MTAREGAPPLAVQLQDAMARALPTARNISARIRQWPVTRYVDALVELTLDDVGPVTWYVALPWSADAGADTLLSAITRECLARSAATVTRYAEPDTRLAIGFTRADGEPLTQTYFLADSDPSHGVRMRLMEFTSGDIGTPVGVRTTGFPSLAECCEILRAKWGTRPGARVVGPQGTVWWMRGGDATAWWDQSSTERALRAILTDRTRSLGWTVGDVRLIGPGHVHIVLETDVGALVNGAQVSSWVGADAGVTMLADWAMALAQVRLAPPPQGSTRLGLLARADFHREWWIGHADLVVDGTLAWVRGDGVAFPDTIGMADRGATTEALATMLRSAYQGPWDLRVVTPAGTLERWAPPAQPAQRDDWQWTVLPTDAPENDPWGPR